jgi:NET1-associated nuclear protein 1 (U3 small nucleolar RNA-associated protein 17)
MSNFSLQAGEEQVELLITSEKLSKHSRQLIAYNLEMLKEGIGKSLYTGRTGVLTLKCSKDGRAIACLTKQGVLIGSPSSTPRALGSLEDLSYQFFSFETEDRSTCLDIRLSQGSKKRRKTPVLDVAIGGARGKILVYQDLIMALRSLETPRQTGEQQALQHQIYHWHRRAVHTLKWSQDGKQSRKTGVDWDFTLMPRRKLLDIWRLGTSACAVAA